MKLSTMGNTYFFNTGISWHDHTPEDALKSVSRMAQKTTLGEDIGPVVERGLRNFILSGKIGVVEFDHDNFQVD